MSTSDNQSESIGDAPDAAKADATTDKTRRELLRMGGYAAAVAPAMLVLMSGKGHAVPPCDSPVWSNGHRNNGHSGC